MSALPWRPIAELPVAPEYERRFVVCRGKMYELVYWLGGNGWALWIEPYDEGDSWSDANLREFFTHFIEITPP